MVAVLSLPHYGETRDIAGMVAFLAGLMGAMSRARASRWTGIRGLRGNFLESDLHDSKSSL